LKAAKVHFKDGCTIELGPLQITLLEPPSYSLIHLVLNPTMTSLLDVIINGDVNATAGHNITNVTVDWGDGMLLSNNTKAQSWGCKRIDIS